MRSSRHSAVATISMLWCILALALAAESRAQMSAEEELKTLRPVDGMEVSLFASEPMITNPSCIDVDTQGRVWVAEIQFYRAGAKNPPADKIKVLEDTDHDGKADKMTVFADGVFAPMSICVCGDKVYAFVQGNLLVWEDKNGDLRADGPPQKLISGFATGNHDHTAHSIVVGPDHKWYMAHGDTGFNATGVDGSKAEYRFGAMVRGELDGSKLETIAVNFRNPYEICVSSFGESFCSDNDNDGNESVRICWILEGGNYGWNGGPPIAKADLDRLIPKGTPYRDAWHFRGHIPGNVPGTLVTGFGSPTGICYYEGDAFGKLKNAPLHSDPGPRVLRVYPHTPAGAGMKATSEVWLTTEGDDYFRPDDVCAAPDGSLLVSDWYDGGVGGHAYNNPDQGRIFLVKPAGKKLARHEKPGPYTNVADAIAGLKSPNLATQFLAREKLLAGGQGSVPALKALLDDAEPNNRARALWVLDRIGGSARPAVVEQLQSEDPAFRALAVRILRRHGDEFAAAILPLASDSNGEVRREVILACGKLSGEAAFKALVSLSAACDGRDRYLLEAINIAAGERKQKLYAEIESQGKLSVSMLPVLQLLNPDAASALVAARLSQSGLDNETARSLLSAAGQIPSIEAGRSLLSLVANDATANDLRQLALSKLLANLGGVWKPLAEEPQTVDTLRKLLAVPACRAVLLDGIRDLGLKAFSADVLAIAQSANAQPADRQQAIAIAVALNADGAGVALRGLLSDKDATVRQAALNAIADLQDMKGLSEVLTSDKFTLADRKSAAARLLESTGGALVLLKMIDEDRLAADFKQSLIATIIKHPDANVRLMYERHIPADLRPKKLGASIEPDAILALTGDVARGEQIFRNSSAAQCKSCHVVQGVGGNVGPDLSMIGRKYERAALLETIMNPSKAISHEYKPHMVETINGQVFVGFVVEKTDAQLVLKDIRGNLIRVHAADVETLVEQQRSLMPELILQEVSAQDAADLLAYLTTLTHGLQTATNLRVLGPFDSGSLATVQEPEKTLGTPDLNAQFKGRDGKQLRWEVTQVGSLPFPSIDLVQYDTSRGFSPDNTTHYFLVNAQTAAAQQAILEIGSDDGVKAWLNGEVIHTNDVKRAITQGEDKVKVQLQPGRNLLVFKVVNGNGGSGFSLAVRSPEPVELKTE